MKQLRWLFTVPLALILIVFAVNNRHSVDVSLWPLDFIVHWPLFVFVYIGVFAGFLAGAAIAWASTAQRHRRTRRRQAAAAPTVSAAPAKDGRATGAGKTPPALTE